ncbi:MAG: hypothetical protein KIT83_11520 [Bryobacterales bacterium]|nr:hypothetical protein [Bryobacterales bacterium]
MSVETRTETAAKDRLFMQSLAVLYLLVNIFLVAWLLQADTAFARIASGFSILGVSALLLQTVDRLRADTLPGTRLADQNVAPRAKYWILIAIGFASWLGLYSVGCRIGAYRYMQAIQQPDIGIADLVWNALVIAGAYTYSNVGILSIITALIGGLARKMAQGDGQGPLRAEVLQGLIPMAMLRSAVIAGVVIAAAIALGSPTTFLSPDPYISFALMMSAVGLINGYMPQWFYREP